MGFTYKHLTEEERRHFVEHGWLRVPNAINRKYIDAWLKDFWVRAGWDEHDSSTWTEAYNKWPRHREVPVTEFCPKAWAKMVEIVGGEDKIDPIRERYYGDQFINAFGAPQFDRPQVPPQELVGWHTDNDWYRQFLDSSGNALTVINCFTDMPKLGGATFVCEDGIKGICQYLYEHPEGIDPPLEDMYQHIKSCKEFSQLEAKAGDVVLMHGLLPHCPAPNLLRYARVITNPHVNLVNPWNLDRADDDYTLCEQVILRALGRNSIPEFKPTRPRLVQYPRAAFFKRERIPGELQRMLADAESRGLGPESVDSLYLRGDEAIREHERRNGYDQALGPNGVMLAHGNDDTFVPEGGRQEIFRRGVKA